MFIAEEFAKILTFLLTLFVAIMPVKDTAEHIAHALKRLDFQRKAFALPMVALVPFQDLLDQDLSA